MTTDEISEIYEALQLITGKFPEILQENQLLSVRLAECLNTLEVREAEIMENKGYIETLSQENELLKTKLLELTHFEK